MEIIWRSTTEVAGDDEDDDDSKIAVIRVNNSMPNILARSLSLDRSLALIRMQRSRERLRLRLRECASERAGERVLVCSSLADSRIIRRSLRFHFICSRADNASGCVCLRLRLRLRVRVWIAPCGSFAIKTKLAPFAIPLRDSDLAVTFLIRKKSPKNFRKHHSKTFSDRQRWRTVACEVPQAKPRIKQY